ncbi:PREDICTED: loricrin-like [Pterocles gutturalis]|uniref:loricrin-like n=1 Tax=Pterocles gutturalis TaxID=240206 RepID=UPI000528B592|nr:PREDICTED: loricrin-like [Pterocles gutturalis]
MGSCQDKHQCHGQEQSSYQASGGCHGSSGGSGCHGSSGGSGCHGSGGSGCHESSSGSGCHGSSGGSYHGNPQDYQQQIYQASSEMK